MLPAVDAEARVGRVRAAKRQSAQQRLCRQRRRAGRVQPVVGAHVVQAHLRAQEPLHGLQKSKTRVVLAEVAAELISNCGHQSEAVDISTQLEWLTWQVS